MEWQHRSFYWFSFHWLANDFLKTFTWLSFTAKLVCIWYIFLQWHCRTLIGVIVCNAYFGSILWLLKHVLYYRSSLIFNLPINDWKSNTQNIMPLYSTVDISYSLVFHSVFLMLQSRWCERSCCSEFVEEGPVWGSSALKPSVYEFICIFPWKFS